MAMSASRSASSARPPAWAKVIPTLTEITCSRSWWRIGLDSSVFTRSAISVAGSRCVSTPGWIKPPSPTGSSTITNSSPPTRATESPARSTELSRAAASIEYRVTGGVSGGVVNPFEVVEVAEQNRDLAPVSIGAIERGADPFDEQTPVRQSGQGVVQRHVGHLEFGQPEQYLVDVPSEFGPLPRGAFPPRVHCGR